MKYGYNLFSAWKVVNDRESLLNFMKQLKELGYDGVEFFEYYDTPAEELGAAAREMGLEPFSTHPRLVRFFNDVDREIDYAKKCGIETLVMPHVAMEDRAPEYYQKVLDAIPGWAEKCKAAGLHLAWHNHDFEFQSYDGKQLLMDEILAADPSVEYEIDTFWTTYAGLDTPGYMEQKKDRIRYVHFKDYKGKTGPGYTDIDFCAVGEGLVDVPAIAKKASEIGVQWAIVEQDLHTKDVLEDAKISLETLKKVFEG